MKNNPTTHIFKSIADIFNRLNLVLFIIVVAGGLIFAIITLSNVLEHPPSDSSQTSGVNAQFIDQATLNRLNKLNNSSDSSGNQVLPSGRINPFSE